jgi:predicted esterase
MITFCGYSQGAMDILMIGNKLGNYLNLGSIIGMYNLAVFYSNYLMASHPDVDAQV